MKRPVLYIRDRDGVVQAVAEIAEQVRDRFPGLRVSDADIAAQLILAAARTPRILRTLGVNGRGRKHSQAPAS